MAVSITWSTTAGGSGISSVAHGTSVNGANTTAQQLFLRHDGANPITACAFFFAQKSGSYTGAATAADDFTELLGWGDATPANDFGGIQVNMDAESIPAFSGGATWGMSETQKSSVDGYKFTARTGVADATGNAVVLSEKMSASMSTNGVIPAGVQDATFEIRVLVPTSEATAGIRQFDQILKFTYTS
jgi:hypothetical protein